MKALTKVAAAVAITLAANVSFAADDCQPGETVIKFSHVTAAVGHPKGEAAAKLAERVNKEMNGKVCMQVFPNKQLYNDKKVLEAMLLGDVQMAAPSLSKFEKYTKKLRIFDLPFMFTDMEAVDRFQQSEAGQKLKNSMRRKGLQGLAFWHNGMKQLSANAPLVNPSDAVGKKFRIMSSDVLKAQFEALKANPQKMAFSEVYSSLQTGVVDGQENTWSNIYTKKFFEVQDGVTESNHGVLDYLVVTSTEFWDSLPGDVQSQLSQILAEVTAEANANSGAINAANRQKIIDAGKEVRQLTTAQRDAWVETLKPVWNKFEKDVGADLIEAAQKANRG
jgi:C4-dicarboxylate-binding protein DctP